MTTNTLYYGDNLDILRAVEDEIVLGQRRGYARLPETFLNHRA